MTKYQAMKARARLKQKEVKSGKGSKIDKQERAEAQKTLESARSSIAEKAKARRVLQKGAKEAVAGLQSKSNKKFAKRVGSYASRVASFVNGKPKAPKKKAAKKATPKKAAPKKAVPKKKAAPKKK